MKSNMNYKCRNSPKSFKSLTFVHRCYEDNDFNEVWYVQNCLKYGMLDKTCKTFSLQTFYGHVKIWTFSGAKYVRIQRKNMDATI